MEKKQLLLERLLECDANFNDIISYIEEKIEGKYEVFAYISQFDGVGNKDSDFDIYVITDKKYSYPVEMIRIKNASCDIEYWEISELLDIANKIDSKNYKNLKLLKKLSNAIPITSMGNISNVRDFVLKIDVDDKVYSYFKSLANAEYDDAVRMYKNEEYISCLCCCQRTINFWMAATNAKNNKANLNLKWANKIFIDNNGFGTQLIDEYLKTFVYIDVTEENIELIVTKMIDFISSYNNVSLF